MFNDITANQPCAADDQTSCLPVLVRVRAHLVHRPRGNSRIALCTRRFVRDPLMRTIIRLPPFISWDDEWFLRYTICRRVTMAMGWIRCRYLGLPRVQPLPFALFHEFVVFRGPGAARPAASRRPIAEWIAHARREILVDAAAASHAERYRHRGNEIGIA
jgi:hypothetical protein